MNRFPCEIIELILKHLDEDHQHACLTVNKTWYAAAIKLVYKTIDIRPTNVLKRFLKALIHNPRSIEAGRYIKEFYIFTYLESYSDEIRAYFIKAMLNCPNIEYIHISCAVENVKVLLDTKMPQLPNLKQIEFLYDHSHSPIDQILQCYYKYRSSLTELNIQSTATSISPDKIGSYITSFPCLTHLTYSAPYKKKHLDFTSILDTVLSQCPKLKSINLHCISIRLPYNDRVTSTYRQVEYLNLSAYQSTSHTTEYIQKRFPCINSVTLASENQTNEYTTMVNHLIQIKSLVNLRINIIGTVQSNTLARFSTLSHPHPRSSKKTEHHATIDLTLDRHASSVFTVRECGDIYRSDYNIHCTQDQLESYLDSIGHCLDGLYITHDKETPNRDIWTYPNLCSALTTFNARQGDLTLPYPPLIHPHLTTLYLHDCLFDLAALQAIDAICPHLQHLVISAPTIQYESVKSNIYPIPLPRRLLSFSLEEDIDKWTELNWMVLKEVKDVPVCAWHICKHTLSVVMSEGDTMLSYIHQLSTVPLFLLISSTVTKVVLKTVNDDNRMYPLHEIE
ncbi:hypothetical protein BDB01DRAFT_803265 [Pilobolus umbonatus]|nr:hypothetical protein BDB01DRAFT_803265 [Pilobolus umbonatus]